MPQLWEVRSHRLVMVYNYSWMNRMRSDWEDEWRMKWMSAHRRWRLQLITVAGDLDGLVNPVILQPASPQCLKEQFLQIWGELTSFFLALVNQDKLIIERKYRGCSLNTGFCTKKSNISTFWPKFWDLKCKLLVPECNLWNKPNLTFCGNTTRFVYFIFSQ